MSTHCHIVCLVLWSALTQGINGHMFDFPSPIHYVDSCGPGGSWAVEGKVTLSVSDLDFFAPEIRFQTSNDQLCVLNIYTSCAQNSTSLANRTDVCRCVNKTGSVLSVEVRRKLRVNETGQMLSVVIPALNDFESVKSQANIGLIPPIFDANVTMTYQIDDAQSELLMTSQNVVVCDEEFTQFTFCAEDRPKGSLVSVTSGSSETRSRGPCVVVREKFDFRQTEYHDVTVVVDDDRGCPVKDKFLLHVYGKDCRSTTSQTSSTTSVPPTTSTQTTVTTSSPSTTSSSSPCASSQLANPIVTLPNGVYGVCDMMTDGGGWVVFQRRTSGSVNFNRRWADYRDGFGDLHGDFWLGLRTVYDLCGSIGDKCQLRLDMRYQGKSYFAEYSPFYLGDETDYFRLHVSNYSGSAGDALLTQNYMGFGSKSEGMPFSTVDSDHDATSSNCAFLFDSGWWFNNCFGGNLNGVWGANKNWEGLNWHPLTGITSGIDFSEMKLRTKH